MNEEPIARVGLQKHKEKKITIPTELPGLCSTYYKQHYWSSSLP